MTSELLGAWKGMSSLHLPCENAEDQAFSVPSKFEKRYGLNQFTQYEASKRDIFIM